jgi:hypothetical protein
MAMTSAPEDMAQRFEEALERSEPGNSTSP